MTPQARAQQVPEARRPDRNEVHLTGRVSGTPEERELPSGDKVATLRVVVTRSGPAPPKRAGERGRALVDTFDVACWTARTRATALRLTAGQSVEVEGALRRRFYRTSTGPASRYEVHAARLRRL